MIDLEKIRQLVELVDESGIDSLEISRFGTRVTIRKSPETRDGASVVPMPTAASGAAPSPGPQIAAAGGGGGSSPGPESGTAEAVREAPEKETEEDLFEVTSPMVGTFYRAPAPDAPPYVEVGDRVETGQTLCILEAMKLMNELESEVAGVIREICVQNAEPVEYGEVLFRIDTGA